jgi:uncharacterized protein YdgA (DUF945 family)
MFLEIYKLIITLNDYELDYNIRARVQALESAIEAKFEAMTRREAFTEYKTAEANTDDRETKRRKYLELAEVHKNWISPKETSL